MESFDHIQMEEEVARHGREREEGGKEGRKEGREGDTLQISTLFAASSISSLRASALAPVGCKLLDKPEDLADCCHLPEKGLYMLLATNHT